MSSSKNFNFRQHQAIKQNYRKKWLELNPTLNDKSGIYILYRMDEIGIKYGYVGQAKHILDRLSQHSIGRKQHIDLSLVKHGYYSNDNIYGWAVTFINCPISELDSKEQQYIKELADKGYQLRNKTSGSQSEGKRQIDEYKPRKGYRDGIEQGKISLARELKDIATKYLNISLKEEKKNHKTAIRMFDKFMYLLNYGDITKDKSESISKDESN